MLFRRIITLALAGLFSAPTLLTAQEPPDADLIDLVIGLLGDADKDVRALAFEQVRNEAKGEAATRQFAAQLANLPDEASVGLLRALGDRGDVVAKPAVIDVLVSSRESSVRLAAISALGLLGDSSDVPRFVELLANGTAAEQAAARIAMIQLRGGDITSSVLNEFDKASTFIQLRIIEILKERRALDAIPRLLQLAVGRDASVRAAAMTALGRLAGPEHIPGMVRGVMKATGSERSDAEKNLMFVCNRIEDEAKRADPLIAAMQDLSPTDQTILLPALGRVGGPEALRYVEAAIASRNSARHAAGLRALSNWPDASISPQLIQLAQSDKHPSHRITALRALIRVAPLPDGRTDDEKLAVLRTAMSMSTRDDEKNLALRRASAIRIPNTLRFVLPYIDEPAYSKQACETVVELAHHRGLRDANKTEFHAALKKVIATSSDAVVLDRANRYLRGRTWVRPKR